MSAGPPPNEDIDATEAIDANGAIDEAAASAIDANGDGEPEPRGRPLIERIGLALVAAVLGLMFAGVAVAAWAGGEWFLGTMGAIGALMTFWVGGRTLLRG